MLMKEFIFNNSHSHLGCIFRRKKKSEKVCLLSAFRSSSLPSFELFFICHEDQRTGMSQK